VGRSRTRGRSASYPALRLPSAVQNGDIWAAKFFRTFQTFGSRHRNAIDARRAIALNRFLYALGIRHVGETNARRLARHFGEWEALRAAARGLNAQEELSAIGGIGPVVAEAIADFFAEPRNEAALDALLQEVTVEPMEAVAAGHPLAGQTIVFSGSLEK
jgi:DNA ligase (NAD+)